LIAPKELRVQVLQEFAEAQAAWRGQQWSRAALRHAARFAEQQASWEETRRVTLATSAQHRASRKESLAKYERSKWQLTRADPEKRAAHNAKRMAAYYRKKAKAARVNPG
jgi:hypothetical protein